MKKQLKNLRMLSQNNLYDYIKKIGFNVIGMSNMDNFFEYKNRVNKKRENNTLYPRTNISYLDYINLDKVVTNPKLIISLGLSYHQMSKHSNESLVGYYTKSSYGIDYHKQIYPKLEMVVNFLKQFKKDLDYYISCDTKVLDDRYFAYLCGNGFYGKNTMIINEEYGSEVFYGTIVVDLDVKVNKPILLTSKCGDCNKCETGCPTNSLNDYILDYKTCLSYLTQSKVMVEPSIIKNSIYGCDCCNNVCPYNYNIKSENNFIEKCGCIPLIDLIRMSNKEYLNYFENKSLLWLNKNIIKKNAILCLGNYLEEYYDVINELEKEVRDKNSSSLLLNAFDYIFKREC